MRRLLSLTAATLVVAASCPAWADEDLDDLMGGFDDDFDVSIIEDDADEFPLWARVMPGGKWLSQHVDIGGFIASAAVWSYHGRSVADSEVPGGTGRTDYDGLSRLDLDGLLQIDVKLPSEWQARVEVLGWYDFSYQIRGRRDFNAAVLDVYEWQVDSGEVYLSGPISDSFDLTIGRKVVNWGRSDTFRVVDVVNPLDNKEPGLVDIEDLRRPRGMLKLDYQSGPWSAQALVLLEHRYDRQPPPGSDFIPDAFTGAAGGGGGLAGGVPIDDRPDFQGTPGFAAKFDGRFSGWDFSIYGAYLDEGTRTVDVFGAGAKQEANRFGMVGAAGNVTRGPILLKAEMAFLMGVRTIRFDATGFPAVALLNQQRDRLDTLVGIEWYGPDQLSVALEIVNRHLFDHPGGPTGINELTPADGFETALRISRPFFRERLDITLLASVFGERAQDGALFRASGEYEISHSFKFEGGWLVFFQGPRFGVGAFDSNDRVYGEVTYSF